MNVRMPGISASCGRSDAITSSTVTCRWARGFSSTNMRPWFVPPVALLPICPTFTPALATFGSFNRMSATCC